MRKFNFSDHRSKREGTNCMHRSQKIAMQEASHQFNNHASERLLASRKSESDESKESSFNASRVAIIRGGLRGALCVSLRQRETNKFTTAVGKRGRILESAAGDCDPKCVFPDVQKDHWADVNNFTACSQPHEQRRKCLVRADRLLEWDGRTTLLIITSHRSAMQTDLTEPACAAKFMSRPLITDAVPRREISFGNGFNHTSLI
jgi:hypothetical protein